MEKFLLDLGLSWTLAKALPYLLMVLLGLFVFRIFGINKRIKNRLLYWFTLVSFATLPFLAYFIVNPIYEGDFANDYSTKQIGAISTNLVDEALTVIVLPGCPFCKEAMSRINKLQERNPNLPIELLVVSENSLDLDEYEKLAAKKMKISLCWNISEVSEIADHGYPSFVLRQGKSYQKWSNNEFGVRALDEIESINSIKK